VFRCIVYCWLDFVVVAIPSMTAAAKKRLQALSQQLVEGIPDAGTFEDIPRIRHVAGDSVGPLVPC
jgi:hypothetical protein